TVVVDRVDQDRADAHVARREVAQVQLPGQVVVQGFGLGHAAGRVALVVLAAAAAAGAVFEAAALGPVDRGLLLARIVAGDRGGVRTGAGGDLVLAVHARRGGVLGPVEQGIALDRGRDLGF